MRPVATCLSNSAPNPASLPAGRSAELALIEVPGIERRLTASFGVASFPGDAADGTTLLRIADRALYAAKANGRNCVVGSAELLAGTSS